MPRVHARQPRLNACSSRAPPAGKSAVVNALLGQRYLAEGILPTTNEINVLKHADPEHVQTAAQVRCDGLAWWCVLQCVAGTRMRARVVAACRDVGEESCRAGPSPSFRHPCPPAYLPACPTCPHPHVQDGDGVFTRYLPAELLREVNVVDTPGTNVILGRQQRLTEEYVPRADLVSGRLLGFKPGDAWDLDQPVLGCGSLSVWGSQGWGRMGME